MMYPFSSFRPNFPPFMYRKAYQDYNYVKWNKPISVENSPDNEQSCKQDQKENSSSSESPVFDVFGIKLYSDDLLILGLLFFLYEEKVQDQELFLTLLLLLLS